MDNLTLENLIFNNDNKPPEYFYEQGKDELLEWSLFNELSFMKFKDDEGYNDRGGGHSLDIKH